MGINLYLMSEFEYRRGLASRLLDEGIIDFCLTDHLPWTESPKHDNRIVEIDHRPAADLEYYEICNLNELPAVSLEVMELMLPYESMAVKMHMRTTQNCPIGEYTEGKRRYLQHLRYWNYMLDKYGINFIICHTIPHSMGSYVVYGLSKIKNIPFLLWTRIGLFTNLCIWGDSLTSIGEDVSKLYCELPDNTDYSSKLSDYICEVRNRYKEKCEKRTAQSFDRGDGVIKFYKKDYRFRKKDNRRRLLRYIARTIVKDKRIPHWFDERLIEFRRYERIFNSYKWFMRHDVVYNGKYLRSCDTVDYDIPYIVFLLQLSPEASILPLAGAFEEQYNGLWILARAADRLGVRVYVREHPEAGRRTKDFYAMLRPIENLYFIGNEETSAEVMKKSICVATQTGTCIIESLLLKKPVIVVGKGYYFKGRPGLFEVVDEESAEAAIRTILEGVVISDNEINKYLYAIQERSIQDVDLKEEEKRIFDSNYVVPPFPLDDRVELIKQFIRKNEL